MAGYLPEMQHLDVRPAIQAYELGLNRGNEDVQQNLLRDVGQTAATQGYDAAGKRALAGGNVGLGVSLQNMSIDRQLKLYDFLGRAAVAADTPEKWSTLNQTLAKTFGPDSVKGFEDFKSRDSAIQLSMSAAQQAQLKLQQEASARAERSLKLQETTAQEKPQYMKDDNGNIVEIAPYGKGARIITPTGAPGVTNPYAQPGKPPSEHESKAALFADRMATAHETLTKNENINQGVTGKIGGIAANVLPEGATVMNPLTSNERVSVLNAQRSFINALLRRESGAAIASSEFTSYAKEYFPQPGDPQEVIDAKRKHRAEVIQGLAREAGRGYSPKFAIDDNGGISARKSGAKLNQLTDAVRNEAQAAIKAGAPKDAVINRLREKGYDPAGI